MLEIFLLCYPTCGIKIADANVMKRHPNSYPIAIIEMFCYNETPPMTGRNLIFFTRISGKSAKLFTRKLCQAYDETCVCIYITSACRSHTIASKFMGILHDRVFL